MTTPANPATTEMPIAVPAELDDPVWEAPALAPVLVAELPDECEPEAPVVAAADAPLAATLARSVYRDADEKVTQLLEAAGVGV